jgi:hypothetical protein
MMHDQWRYVCASVAGTSHQHLQLPCQDASICRVLQTQEGEPVLVAVAADGAGSAQRAEVGAQVACSLLIQEMEDMFACGGVIESITRDFCGDWITHFQSEIRERAHTEDLKPRDYACTVLAAVVGRDTAVFLHVGDGAIVVPCSEEPENYTWVSWPQKGEFQNQTLFLTDEAACDRFAYDFAPHRIDEVALFTDGIERLALHFGSQQAHSPFFRPMFAAVRGAQEGCAGALTDELHGFLSSPAVNDRTDDDKTLILATRRQVCVTILEEHDEQASL